MEEFKIRRYEGPLSVFKEPIKEILNRGEVFIDMSTSLHPVCYNDREIKQSIENCVKKVAKLRILLDRQCDIEKLRREVPYIFSLKDDDPNTVKIAKAVEDIPHCIIVDGRYFRIEGKHQTNAKGEIVTRNLIIEDPPPFLHKLIWPDFDVWWNKAEKI